MFNIRDINNWKQSFGLFPISIMATDINKYALLNGGQQDFCIDLNPTEDNVQMFNSYAWSANTKNYLAISKQNVTIYNWLKNTSEAINVDVIQRNINTFYNYIGQQTYSTDNDVIPFILAIFRKMRNLTREESSPQYALSLLYTLLMSLEYDIYSLDYSQWAIEKVEFPDQFNYFVDELKNGIGRAKPNLEIILRHCSGPIFQEAHRIVQTFFPDRDLFGDVSSKLFSFSKEYSSSHYTPQYVARSIVEQVLKRFDINKPRVTIFDPACGSAEFLMEILKQLHDKRYAGEIIINGWDCSESATSTSKFLLNYEKEIVWHERLSLNIRTVHDSLQENWGCDADIILMNPPFVSWELLNDSQRQVVSECLPHRISKPNQSIAFLKKAIDALQNGGILGCIMPSSTFSSDAYALLREELKEELSSLLVAKLGNFVFENALTDVSLYVGSKPANTCSTRVLWCKNENGVAQDALCALRKMEANNLINEESERYSIYTPISYPYTDNSWKIVSKKDLVLKEQLENFLIYGELVKLQSIFSVKQGIRTGGNKLFIISDDTYNKMSDSEKQFYRKSIDNDAIEYCKLNTVHYVWYPYNTDGLFIRSEGQLREEAPVTYERLIRFKNKLESRNSINDKSCWWSLSRHRDWLLKTGKRLVSTEFGNSKSFAIDNDGKYVIERGYAWIPKKEFRDKDYYFYLAFFASSTFENILSIYTRQLAGGAWYDLSAKYMNSIPIPDIHRKGYRESIPYVELSQLGELISKNGSFFYIERVDEIIDSLIIHNYA